MAISQTSFLLGLGVVLLFCASPVAAFGAGDIVDVSNINNVNWRHGDIENILLELAIRAGGDNFEKLDIKRVYFGNWLRDYSQAIDVGGLKQLPADTIRILLWCLSFLTFGYATGEFEVTADRLGCYRPEEHIDNPKDYADNEDARKYDQRLRGPVDEGKELAVDPETGVKVYIASENSGIETSAGLVRRLFEHAIELGRNYHKNNNDTNAFYEALRLLGTGLHCLEDFSAHSNYTELALKELGVDAFPHVGKATEIDVKGKKVFPLVTGTFGMTDFLHSVVGEAGDKVAQSEIEALESKLDAASAEDEKNNQISVLKAILDKVPWELLSGDDKPDPGKADELKAAADKKAEEVKNNPPDPNASLGGVNIEEAKKISAQTLKDMYPILEFHDRIRKAVAKITSKVPGLDELTENLFGALTIFVFSLLSPFVKPIIAQARVELKSTSEGVLKTSLKGQYEVFENDKSTDPTHSMLSKDHFSNVLNPVAGQIAVSTVKFVVPLIVEAWADDGKDVRQVIDNILQVFHHPALRDENKEGQKAMFETVKHWWEDKSDEEKEHLKEILTFDGVKDGKNHEGESADGHGGHSHGAPVKSDSGVPSAQQGASAISGLTGGLTNLVLEKTGLDKKFGKVNTSSRKEETSESSYSRPERTEESSYGGNTSSSYGRKNDNEESTETSYGGNTSSSYGRKNDNEESSYGGNTSSYGRKNDNEESSYGGNTSSYGQTSSYGRKDESEETSYGGNTSSYGRKTESSSYGQDDNETSTYGSGRKHQESSYGSGRNDNEESSYGGSSNTYGSSRRNDDNESSSYGGNTTSHSRRDDNESSGYGGSSNTYGSSRRHDDNETSSYGGGNTYGSSRNEESSYSSRRDDNESSSYGGGYGGSSRRNDDNEESSYSSRRDDNESSGYGGSSSRRRNNEEEESSGYGGGSRY